MDTVQLLFRTRAAKSAKKDKDLLDKVQSYLGGRAARKVIHSPLGK